MFGVISLNPVLVAREVVVAEWKSTRKLRNSAVSTLCPISRAHDEMLRFDKLLKLGGFFGSGLNPHF